MIIFLGFKRMELGRSNVRQNVESILGAKEFELIQEALVDYWPDLSHIQWLGGLSTIWEIGWNHMPGKMEGPLVTRAEQKNQQVWI